jgi:hypothetical protein
MEMRTFKNFQELFKYRYLSTFTEIEKSTKFAPTNFLALKSRSKFGQFWAFWGAMLPPSLKSVG